MTDLWFKTRRYGWGWTPASLAGWLVIANFVALIVVGAVVCVWQVRAGADRHWAFVLFTAWIALLVAVVAAIGYAKGEPPRWRWGR